MLTHRGVPLAPSLNTHPALSDHWGLPGIHILFQMSVLLVLDLSAVSMAGLTNRGQIRCIDGENDVGRKKKRARFYG